MKRFTSLLVLILFNIAFTNAQWSTDPATNNLINSYPTEQTTSKIANCADGYVYIGFYSKENDNYNIRLQRLDPQGYELWQAGGILISDHTQKSWLTDWDMTADTDGNAIITFQDIRNGGFNNVVAYKISPDGGFLWGEDGIALSNSYAEDVSPKVAITNAGNIVFAWHTDDVIIRQKLDPSGNLLWGPDGKTLAGSDEYKWPQLLPVGADEIIMKYFHDIPQTSNTIRHVYARKYDANGDDVWANPVTITNAGGISTWSGHIFPFINDGNDGFYIAWEDDRNSDMINSVYLQHVSSSGATIFIDNGLEVCTTYDRQKMYPVLGFPPGSSTIFVFWNEMNVDMNMFGIFGQKVNAMGGLLWGNSGKIFINLSSINVHPTGSGNSMEDMVVFYEQYSSETNSNLKAMRIDVDGNFVWASNFKTISSVDSYKGAIVVSDFINNQWILSWDDKRSDNKDIYAQNIQLNGELGPYYPQPGSISGLVSFLNGNADPTLAMITAGSQSVNPSADGSYLIDINPGTYMVTATHPYCSCDTIEGVIVYDGQATEDIDFALEVTKADIVCKALDDFTGQILNNVDLEIYGPADTLYGTITNDSLVFQCKDYGFYEGFAYYALGSGAGEATIDSTNHSMIFMVGVTSSEEQDLKLSPELFVYPNPFVESTNIRFSLSQPSAVTISAMNMNGTKYIIHSAEHPKGDIQIRWNGKDINGYDLSKGIYTLILRSDQGSSYYKIIRF